MEDKNLGKPKSIWQNALKVVKGESTEALIEQFTSEMTLVAEGLCDDQEKLKREIEAIRRDQDRMNAQNRSEQEAQERNQQDALRNIDRRLDELTRRTATLEAKMNSLAAAKAKPAAGRWKSMGLIGQLCVLAGIIGAILIITLLLR